MKVALTKFKCTNSNGESRECTSEQILTIKLWSSRHPSQKSSARSHLLALLTRVAQTNSHVLIVFSKIQWKRSQAS